jgi:hydroxymethylbilane synthase
MIPGVGQGAIGLQVRKDDMEVVSLVNTMKHVPTFQAVTAERALLNTLDSGCQFPIGGYASVNNNQLNISGFVGDENGTLVLVDHLTAKPEEAEFAGQSLAFKLIDRGALSLLEAFKNK